MMIDTIPLWFAFPATFACIVGWLVLEFRSAPTWPADLSAADVADGVGSREVTS